MSPTPPTPVKAGWKTTEFWLTVIAVVGSFSPLLPAHLGTVLSSVAVTAYNVSRALVKAFAPPVAVALLAAACLASGCAGKGPAPAAVVTAGHVVNCGASAVAQCAPQALGQVNECLGGQGDVTTCLLALIATNAPCLASDIIACIVHHEGTQAAADAAANPADTREARRAARASEYLAGQHVIFAPGS